MADGGWGPGPAGAECAMAQLAARAHDESKSNHATCQQAACDATQILTFKKKRFKKF